MTKITGKTKDMDTGQFIILRKLADGSKLHSTAFESPRYNDISNHESLDSRNSDTLSHSSADKRLNELVKEGSIKAYNIDKKPKIRQRKEYRITIYGFIKLLGLSHDRGFLADVMEKIPGQFFISSDDFEFLKPIFTEKLLFDTITAVCKNTKIVIDFDAKKKPKYIFLGVPSTILTNGITWAHQYYIEIKVQHLESSYILKRFITIKGAKKDQTTETVKVFNTINGLINTTFFYELLMRCKRHGAEFSMYPHDPKIIKKIINRLSEITYLQPYHIKFLKHMKLKHDAETEIIDEFRSSLDNKKASKYEDVEKAFDIYDLTL